MSCPASLHKRIAHMRRLAYDIAHAGYSTYPDFAVKEAERAARNGDCSRARTELKASIHSARKALKKMHGRKRR